MQNKGKILLAILITVLLTYLSLAYESTYSWYHSQAGNWQMSPSWGFPFQYVFDNEVSSPVYGMNIEDTVKIIPLIGNLFIYSIIIYFTLFRKKDLQTSHNNE